MSVFKAAFNISFFTLISRVTGFVRDIILAYKLGAGPLADILFIALKIPNFFRRIFAEGAFSQSFVPSYSKIMLSQNIIAANKFANHIFYFFIIALLFLTVVFEVFMPYILIIFAPGYINITAQYQQAVALCQITFPYIIFISIVSLLNGVLNSHKIFIPGSVMPIIYNFTLIISLLALFDLTQNHAYSIAYGLIMTGIFQLLIMLFIAKKNNLKLYPSYNAKLKQESKKFLFILLPAILAASIIQLNSMVDTIIATLIPNAVSYLYYCDRLIQLPLSLLGFALSTAMLPTLSQEIKLKNYDKAQNLMNQAINISLFFALPATIGLFMLSQEIIYTLFLRGEFSIITANATANLIKIYSLAIPAFILVKILMTDFYSRSNMKTPIKVSFLILVMNLMLNLILINYYSYLGIAIATVISSWCNVFILLILIIKKKYNNFIKFNFNIFSKILCSSIALIITIFLLKNYIISFDDANFTAQLFFLIVTILVSVLCYFSFAVLTKIITIADIIKFKQRS